jgi:CelD/BcsL family acetyltransferase involved in cellulose biosynthesis
MRMSLGIEKNIQVKVFGNFDELAPIQKEWDDFVESEGGDIFLTYDWSRVWWKYYGEGRELSVFIFRNDGNLVGIIPVFFEKIRLGPIAVKAVKIVGADYNLAQFFLPIRFEYMELVINVLFKVMSQEKWDIVHLGPMAGLYPHTDHLIKAINGSMNTVCRVFVKRKGEHTYFHLSDSWEKQLEKMNKSDQKDISRSYRRLRKNLKNPTVNVEISYATKKNFQLYFDEFVKMHQTYWHKIGKAGHFEDWPDAIEFHREMAEKQLQHNRLRLLKIFAENNCLGYEYDYWFGNRCFELLAGRSEEEVLAGVSVGKINYSEKMHNLIRNNIYNIDSMRGRYAYKLRLGGKAYPTENLYVVPRKGSIFLRVLLFYIFSRILHICYYKIWYCRMARIFPVKRCSLWEIWIRSVFLGN